MVEVTRPSGLIISLRLYRFDHVAKVVDRDAETRADINDAGIRHTVVPLSEQLAVKTVWLFRHLPCRAWVKGPAAKTKFPAVVLESTEESHSILFLHVDVLAQNRAFRLQELVDVEVPSTDERVIIGVGTFATQCEADLIEDWEIAENDFEELRWDFRDMGSWNHEKFAFTGC